MYDNIQYIKSDFLPRCLRHSYEGSALESAEYLISFLQDAIEGILKSSTSMESQAGLGLCFDLLRDKLTIASGNLPFPLVSDYNIEKKGEYPCLIRNRKINLNILLDSQME